MSDRVNAPRPPLPVPLESVLDDGPDDLTLERTWRRVSATRDVDLAPRGPRTWRLKRLVPVGVFVATAVFAAQPLSKGLGQLFGDAPGDGVPQAIAPVPEATPEPTPRVALAPLPIPVAVSPPMPVTAPEQVPAPERPAPEETPLAPVPATPPRLRVPKMKHVEEGEPVRAPPAWAERWRSGDLDGALSAVGPEGFATEVRRNHSVDELFLLADLARVAGQPMDALAALERVGELHPGAPWGGLAAFTAGKLKLEATGDPAGAAAAFSRALELGLPEALAAQAVARRDEALRRSGGAD